MTDLSGVPSQGELRAQYQALHDGLSQAREHCSNAVQANLLRKKAEDIQDVLTALDQSELRARTPEFESVGQQIAAVNADLQIIKGEISGIVKNVGIATKVVGAIDSVLGLASKFFG